MAENLELKRKIKNNIVYAIIFPIQNFIEKELLNIMIDKQKRNLSPMILKTKSMGSMAMKEAMNDPKHKVCKECQFEAQNGHHRSCSQYGSAAKCGRFIDGKYRRPCPICQQQGRFGTLDILTAEETKRLKEREGKDSYPDRIAGCDECRFWCDADEIENI